jgi:hypothetical protein
MVKAVRSTPCPESGRRHRHFAPAVPGLVRSTGYVVIELKTGKFQPEYAGKLQFYIALVDDKLRRPAHAPTVGILICGSRNEHTVRYALNQSSTPMAVSTYTYETLPAAEQQALPDAEDLAAALDWAEPD